MNREAQQILAELNANGQKMIGPACEHVGRDRYAVVTAHRRPSAGMNDAEARELADLPTLLLFPGPYCERCTQRFGALDFAMAIEFALAEVRGTDFSGEYQTDWKLKYFTEAELCFTFPLLGASLPKKEVIH